MECTYCRVASWCGKTLIERIKADRAAIVAEWNSSGWPDMKYVKRQKLSYVEYRYKCSCIAQYTSTDIRRINFTFNS